MRVSNFLICLLFFYSLHPVFAQKAVLDSAAYVEWPSIGKQSVSNDGKYVIYTIENKPVGAKTLVLVSSDLHWRREFVGQDGAALTSDSKFALFMKGKDSLAILTLGTNAVQYVPHAGSFVAGGNEKKQWICYNMDSGKSMILRELNSGLEYTYENVLDKWLSEDGKTLVLKSIASTGRYSLNWIDINGRKNIRIWEGENIDNLVFDKQNSKLAFRADSAIWNYKYGSFSAVPVVTSESVIFQQGQTIGSITGFSNNGRILYFTINVQAAPKDTKGTVEVWSYRDMKLQSEKKAESNNMGLLGAVNLVDRQVHKLEEKDDFSNSYSVSRKGKSGFILARNSKNGLARWIETKENWSLTDIQTGKRIPLTVLEKRNILDYLVQLSPDEKFIVFFDTDANNYFTYEIATKTIRNITDGIPVSWTQLNLSDDGQIRLRGVAGWLKNDAAILLYDQYDIWKIDPLGKRKPVNITNGFGLKNNMVFSLALSEYLEEPITEKADVVLNAFDRRNKNNGFFSKKIGVDGDPVLLSMGPYIYQLLDNPYVTYDYTTYPDKAKDAKIYVVRRTAATESPNYFITKDFRTFDNITDLHPEKNYNWCTSELHAWRSLDGRSLQGVLYKPENFDPQKKYPVIFYYYERLSDRLNASLIPDFSIGPMNIPTYVSNGYLVFTPDIYYTVGDPFQGTYDAVVSAAQYVSQFSYVDPKKMGIQGHSFGGVQTNYLVTHTSLFAAACSASGKTDLVAAYGSLFGGIGNQQGPSMQNYYEDPGEQGRMGATLWEAPDAYIRNSPIFRADKVTTPLLMMHTKKDDICLYSNAMEFFTGLRRLGKKVWMLVYSEGNHCVNGKESEDYTIRMMQFFDHYLKDKPAPLWMLDGIPAARRGIDNGLLLDTSGRTPGPGLLSKDQQQKVDSLMSREPMTTIFK